MICLHYVDLINCCYIAQGGYGGGRGFGGGGFGGGGWGGELRVHSENKSKSRCLT